jgi:hypothetical protein
VQEAKAEFMANFVALEAASIADINMKIMQNEQLRQSLANANLRIQAEPQRLMEEADAEKALNLLREEEYLELQLEAEALMDDDDDDDEDQQAVYDVNLDE